MPQFDVRLALHEQSLALRHVQVEDNEAFGGGGEDLGAVLSLDASTLDVQSVDFVGNTQRGFGAGVIFAVASNASFDFARFEQSRNLGLGAGVLSAAAGSRVAFSHSHFRSSFAENQMGLVPRADGGPAAVIARWNIADWRFSALSPASCAQFQGATSPGCSANPIDQDATPEVDDMRWEIPRATSPITLDGDLRDWAGIPFKAQTPFRQCNTVDGAPCAARFVEFDGYNGGAKKWHGPASHSAAIAFAWNPEALHTAVKVFDDTHQGQHGWNGDCLQFMYTHPSRSPFMKRGNIVEPGGTILYNFGIETNLVDWSTITNARTMDRTKGHDPLNTIHPEAGGCGSLDTGDPCGIVMAGARVGADMITTYEFKFPARALGLDSLKADFAFGLTLLISDGDTGEGQGGQRGWSGWAPYGIVYGKSAQSAGLVRLVEPNFGDPTGSISRAAQQRSSCISADDSAISATHSLFEGNAGGDVITARAGSTVDLADSTFQQNDLAAAGAAASVERRYLGADDRQSGALSLREGSVATLARTSFIGNLGGAAGAIFATHGSVVTFDQGLFKENEAGMQAPWRWRYNNAGAVAGAIVAQVGTQVRGTRSAFIANWATGNSVIVDGISTMAAGAILASGSAAVHAEHCEFIGNMASAANAAGGASSMIDHAHIYGAQCMFQGNSAASQFAAGAVYAGGISEIILMNTTLHNNRAKAHETAGSGFGGGGICTDSSSLSLTRASVTDNVATASTKLTASNFADSLYVSYPPGLAIRDSTFEPLAGGGKTVAVVSATEIAIISEITEGSCQQCPCSLGSKCTYSQFSTSCEACPEGTHSSDGIDCRLCPPGTGPSTDQTRCEPCGGTDDPLIYSPNGICLDCYGDNVVSNNRSECSSCPIGLGPANAERTHCAPCQGNMVSSKFGVCEPCPAGEVGDGDGILCSSCPPNAEPSDIPLVCRCKVGYYNSTFGIVRCRPSPMPAAQNGVACQPCGACLDCETSLSTFTRALVQPGYKLGIAATKMYRGVEHGSLHVKKVFHECSHGMCTGEAAQNTLSRETASLKVTVTNVDTAVIDLESEAHAVFGSALALSVAQALAIRPDDIAVHTVMIAPSSSTVRRWLQELVDVTVSFTIVIDAEQTTALQEQIELHRNTTGMSLVVGNSGATALTSTFTQPVIVPRDAVGVRCAEGHDPTSPLCHVCLDGWREDMDQTCAECEAETLAWFQVMLLGIGFIVACLLVVVAHHCYQMMAAKGAMKDQVG
jgi:hypothetical protein